MSSDQYDYAPSKEEDDDGSTENLLKHTGDSDIHWERTQRRRPGRYLTIALHATAIILYGVVSLLITFYLNNKHNRGQSLIYSPATKIIDYTTQVYDPHLAGDPEWFGEPSPEIDHNWHELLEPSSIHLTESERQHYDAGTPIVQFPDGTYFGQLWVYHELHCLKRLYQYINSDYYFPNLTKEERELNKKHNEHCFGMLRQGVMCHGDVSVMTMVWGKTSRVPYGDFSSPHQCVNFDKLHQWALKRAVTDAREPGILVHPKLGSSFPDGHGTKIGFSDEDIDENGNVVTDD